MEILRTCRMTLPIWRAAPGSLSGPKTTRATTTITAISAHPRLPTPRGYRSTCFLRLSEPEAATNDEGVPPRISALRIPPLGFAHRGARAHERENTLAAFSLALVMGAAGLESDVWVTADGQAVLDHDGLVRSSRWHRKRPILECRRDDLPDHIPTLAELYTECGTGFDLSLDLKDAAAAPAVIQSVDAAAARTGEALRERLWLCHPDIDALIRLRERWPDVRLCNSTRLGRMDSGPERRAAELADAGIDSVNLHQTDWTGGLVTLFHRFGVLCFGWDAQQPRVLNELMDMGIDAVYSDHVDRMGDALAYWYPDWQ